MDPSPLSLNTKIRNRFVWCKRSDRKELHKAIRYLGYHYQHRLPETLRWLQSCQKTLDPSTADDFFMCLVESILDGRFCYDVQRMYTLLCIEGHLR